MKIENGDECLDDTVKQRKTDSEVKTEIEKYMFGQTIGRLQGMEKAERNEVLRNVKAIEGVSLRQISRVTGISVDIIFNA